MLNLKRSFTVKLLSVSCAVLFFSGAIACICPAGFADTLRVQSLASNDLGRMQEAAAITEFTEHPTFLPLECKRQPYAWGGKENIPRLLGEDPTDKPCAELWIGAHTAAPAEVTIAGITLGLDALIDGAGPTVLGKGTAETFNNKLPYLFKLLDAEEMLSIQVHPTKERAQQMFAEEEAATPAIPQNERSYKDDNHKPEAAIALTELYAVVGFRPLDEIATLLETTPEFADLSPDFTQKAAQARGNPTKEQALIKALFSYVMQIDQLEVNSILGPLIYRLKGQNEEHPFREADPEYWVLEADKKYTQDNGDIDRGIFALYFLNLVHLTQGQGVFLDAGVPHAYLRGFIIECMANSDDVLRVGLTPKFKNIPEVLKVLTFTPGAPAILKPQTKTAAEQYYDTPAPEFTVSFITVNEKTSHTSNRFHSADSFIVLEGSVMVRAGDRALTVRQGDTFLIPAALGAYTITGNGTLAKASTPLTPHDILAFEEIDYALVWAEEGIDNPETFKEIITELLAKTPAVPIRIIAKSHKELDALKQAIGSEALQAFQKQKVGFAVLNEQQHDELVAFRNKAEETDPATMLLIDTVRVFNITDTLDAERKIRDELDANS